MGHIRLDTLELIFVHFLPTLGFVLALVILSRVLTERRSPASTLAWLMAIAFIPYVAVPLYLLIGGRKMKQMAGNKPMLANDEQSVFLGDQDQENHQNLPLPTFSLDDEFLISPWRPGVFPITGGNHTILLADGMQAFVECMRMIEGAEKSIHIATFILGKDETGRAIVDALARKAQEGVEVRLLLDAIGCIKITRRFLRPLTNAGGQVAFFMPMLHLPFRGRANLRIHRKMLIADGQAAIMGGMNMAEEYMGPSEPRGRWRDLSMRVEGPVVAHLHEIFRSDWAFASGQTIDPVPEPPPLPDPNGRDVDLQLIASGPDVPNDSLREAIITALFLATTRVWIVTPYFVPDQMLSEALCMAAGRGVDVRIIVPEKSNHKLADLAREGYMEQLAEAGGTIVYYTPGMLHAKALVIDNSVAAIGSANMDMRSLLLNYEVALWIYSPKMIKQLDAWMTWLQSESRRSDHGSRRTLGLIHGIGRLFAPLL